MLSAQRQSVVQHVKTTVLVLHQICARAHPNGKSNIVSEKHEIKIHHFLIGLVPPAQRRSVAQHVRIMEHVLHQTFAIGKHPYMYLSLRTENCRIFSTSSWTGTACQTRKKGFFLEIVIENSNFCTAVCSPSCLNGGNCTAPNTCTCELY